VQSDFGAPDVCVGEVFVFEQGECDDEWELHDEQREEEDEEGSQDLPEKCEGGAEVDFGEFVVSEGGFVNDVEVETEEPAPGEEVCDVVAAAYCAGEEEFEADGDDDESECGDVFAVDEKSPAFDENGAIESGEGLGFFSFGLDYLRCLVVFCGDYEDLAAALTLGAFSDVPAVESDQVVAFGAVERDGHVSDLFHCVDEAADVVGPFFCLEEVYFVGFDEHGEMLFHGYHFFVGLVLGFGLEL